MPFEFEKLVIPTVILIKPKVFKDNRGFFLETFEENAFKEAGIPDQFTQDNHSKSQKGVLRGMHFQTTPYEQAKLVRAIKGKILDVAVDLRKDSETYMKCVSAVLSEENKHMLYIPKGFAHGFLTLEDAEVVYKCSGTYAPKSESGIRYDQIDFEWPIKNPILSKKDEAWDYKK